MRKHGLTIDNLLAAEILTALAEPVADLLRPRRYSELFPDEPRSPMDMVTRTTFAGSVGSSEAETILGRIGESSAAMAAYPGRDMGPAGRGEGGPRPREPVPAQPERPAGGSATMRRIPAS